MIRIKPECQENAIGQTRTQAALFASMGDNQYYVLDGNVWLIDEYGVCWRSEQEESSWLIPHLREHGQRPSGTLGPLGRQIQWLVQRWGVGSVVADLINVVGIEQATYRRHNHQQAAQAADELIAGLSDLQPVARRIDA